VTLLLLLLALPGQRFVNLPTGVLPESHVWHVCVAHRFLPAVTAPGWDRDPLQAFTGANVRVTVEKSLGDRWVVGITDAISSRVLGLGAAFAPLPWLTVYPELNTHLYGLKLDSTWLNIGFNFHRTWDERLAVTTQPRITTNTRRHFVSLGLAAKSSLGSGYAVALEAEPVLFGRDSTTRQLALAGAVEKEVGWHSFVLTLGTPREQTAPALFRSAGEPTAYSDVLDAFKGHFRIGFNLLRKI